MFIKLTMQQSDSDIIIPLDKIIDIIDSDNGGAIVRYLPKNYQLVKQSVQVVYNMIMLAKLR